MRRAPAILAISLLPILTGASTLVLAQDTAAPTKAPAQEKAAPQGSILLQQLTGPRAPVPGDSITRDDLRAMPTPRADRLSESSHVIVVVGDPRCFPGDEFIPLPPPRARRR